MTRLNPRARCRVDVGLSIRVFTTATEIDDRLALVAVAVPCCLNVVLLGQLLLLPGGGKIEQKKE